MTDPDRTPLVFLLGVPRSGTTLLSLLLDSHPQIASPPEPWLMLAVQALGRAHPLHPAGSHLIGQAHAQFVDGLDIRRAQAACAAALYGEYLQREGKSIFVDKTPRYYQIIEEIGAIFPACKFIYLKRNPFAVLGSMKSSWNFDLCAALAHGDDELLFDFVLGYRWLDRFAADNPARVHACSYDDLVAQTEHTLRPLLGFLGVDHDVALQPFAAENLGRRRGHLGDQKILATRSIHQDSLSTWRSVLSREEKQAIHDIFSSETIRALGFGELLAVLREDGIVDHGMPLAQDILARVEGNYRSRQHLIDVSTHEWSGTSRLIAALRKAARQPDEAIQLLGVEENALALIERQAVQLKKLEDERSYFLTRMTELGRLTELLGHDGTAQGLHRKVDELLEKAAADQLARKNLEELVDRVLEAVKDTQEALIGGVRRIVENWRR